MFNLSKATIAWYLIALAVILVDQVSKYLATASLEMHTPIIFTSFFNFTLMYNEGAAFSFLSDAGGWQRYLFSGLAGAVSIGLVIWLARIPSYKRWEPIALALVLGGAIGNLYDRVVLGHVVDFIVVHYQDHYWPAFNIADSAISVGAIMLVIDAFFGKKKSGEMASENLDKQ
ncbi:signal peptidase II [Sessilibacter sp. MAH2]